MFTMDQATFGLPNWNLSQTQQDQFKPLLGSVGRGLYREYNQTGSIPVTMQWTFNSAQMRMFNAAWTDRAKFCWGAAWFLMDLPLGLDAGDAPTVPEVPVDPTGAAWSSAYSSAFVGAGAGSGSDWSSAYSSAFVNSGSGRVAAPQMIDVAHTLELTVGSGGFSLGWESGVYGSIVPNPPVLGGSEFNRIHYDTRNDIFFLNPTDDTPIPGDETTIEMSLPTSAAGFGKRYLANWGGPTTRYQFLSDDNLRDVWINGATLPLIVWVSQPLWRTYRITPTDNRQTQMIGPDAWSVSLPVLVDVSPPTDWFAA